jgi:transglutaminase-like putative cysteine protease
MATDRIVHSIAHITKLRYDEPVVASYNEVRMQPRERRWQRLRSMSLVSSPPSLTQTRIDYFGNVVHRVDVDTPHTSLELHATATVESTPGPEHRPTRWAARQLEGDPRLEYVLPSPRVPLDDSTRELLRSWAGEARDFDALVAMAQRINREFRYERGSTTVDSSIDDLLRGGGGVCQDFTHLFIALCRHAGWPARYVSGYVGPHADETVATGESHAWVEICGPKGQWVGVDPTHGRLAGIEHIELAVGRDYSDVPPHRGLFYGGAAAREPEVSVEVTRIAALDDNRLVVRRRPHQQMAQQQQQ